MNPLSHMCPFIPESYEYFRPWGHLARGCAHQFKAVESHYCRTSPHLAPGVSNGAPEVPREDHSAFPTHVMIQVQH